MKKSEIWQIYNCRKCTKPFWEKTDENAVLCPECSQLAAKTNLAQKRKLIPSFLNSINTLKSKKPIHASLNKNVLMERPFIDDKKSRNHNDNLPIDLKSIKSTTCSSFNHCSSKLIDDSHFPSLDSNQSSPTGIHNDRPTDRSISLDLKENIHEKNNLFAGKCISNCNFPRLEDFPTIEEIEESNRIRIAAEESSESVVDMSILQNEHESLLCIVCGVNLHYFSNADRECHMITCIDAMQLEISHCVKRNKARSINIECVDDDDDADAEDLGIRGKLFFCVICDLDLSGRGLFPRCMHLKKCAKTHGMATRELLTLIAPVFEEIEIEDDGDVDDDDGFPLPTCLKSCNDNIDLGKALGEERGGLIVIDDYDDDNECATSHDKGQTTVPATAPKNAWTVLMNSSKQSNGFFEPSSITNTTLNYASSSATNRPGLFKTRNNSNPTSTATASGADTTGRGQGQAQGQGRKWGAKGFGSNKSSNGANIAGVIGYAPAYKKIQQPPMTCAIIVDGFQYAAKQLSDCYFLTHFHSDHYMGLDKSFDCGSIYCSPATAGLVRLKLRIQGPHLISLELDKLHTISVGGVDVQVIFTDANHCPGAVCILFLFPNGKKILHTGDFRWNPEVMLSSPVFKSLLPGVNTVGPQKKLSVYLDTTYCDPNFDFPLQRVAINTVLKYMRLELAQPRTLFLFGAYGIGKERVYMAVAEENNMRVYVDKTRWKSMMCYDWTVQEQARLTTVPSQSVLWVVPMNNVNFHSAEVMLKKRPDCNRVVAFQPTGWTHDNNKTTGVDTVPVQSTSSSHTGDSRTLEFELDLVPRCKSNNKIYSVPYSEHSSFGELVDFIKTFRPEVVIPTVNTGVEKVKGQLQLLRDKSGVYNDKRKDNSSALLRSEFS